MDGNGESLKSKGLSQVVALTQVERKGDHWRLKQSILEDLQQLKSPSQAAALGQEERVVGKVEDYWCLEPDGKGGGKKGGAPGRIIPGMKGGNGIGGRGNGTPSLFRGGKNCGGGGKLGWERHRQIVGHNRNGSPKSRDHRGFSTFIITVN
ncbi:hypothetical protein L0F63_006992 [Massospora cicadina]|nr:hypothetical protein L0F63_006992 [Massospora cicadina]